MTTRMLAGLWIAATVGLAAAPVTAAAIQLEPVVTGLSSPLFVTNARDGGGRLFVIEQGGVIKMLQPGETAPTVFLDITTRVLSGGEQGLLGLAFHPQFASNRRFFVDYTRQPDGATVIAEYQVSAGNPNVADLTEKTLLVIAQPFANHNGGMVEFGPDGFLYIGMGDGGAGNDPDKRAQDINQLLGKILRIDVDHPNGSVPYSSPSTNPFFGATPGRDEIFAYGMRNPWRFSFDRETGQLYAGDVGQGAVEEIDIVTLGGNYGWRTWEGTICTGLDPGSCSPAGFIFPIAQYAHTGGRCSVTGGYVYRGTRATLPTGTYVYADYCTGEIFQFLGGTSSLLLDTGLNIASFGEDEAGEIYVVGLGGTVYRILSVIGVIKTEKDFNGDGRADLLLRHTSGVLAIWLIDGTAIIGAGSLAGAGPEWTVESLADFNGDGKADVLLRHTSGVFYVWLMNGTTISSGGSPGSVDAAWTIEGIGDFNRDGKADILWRHTSGVVYIWLMDGSNIMGAGSPGAVGTDWTIEGVGDFDGNGKADIFWRHSGGLLSIWLMNGTSISSAGSPGSVDAAWTVHGIGDFDGNGKADILWRHSGGLLSIWLMNATTISSAGSPGSVGLDWAIQDAVDFDGDGKADVLWRHTSGQIYIWLMNGTAISSAGSPGAVGPEWQIQ